MPFTPPTPISDALFKRGRNVENVFNQCVYDSFSLAAFNSGGQLSEVPAILAFFYHGLPVLERRLNRVLSRAHVQVTVTGVFCHQRPYVIFSGVGGCTGHCELGDLLIVVTYGESIGRQGLGNAALIQAKLTTESLQQQTPQRDLYEKGLSFEYKSNSYGGGRRVLPAQSSSARWYWILTNERRFIPSHWGASEVLDPRQGQFDLDMSFGEFALSLLCGRVGRGFLRPAAANCGWDRIIFDLLQVTATKAIGSKGIYSAHANKLRGESAIKVIGKLSQSGSFLITGDLRRALAAFQISPAATNIGAHSEEELLKEAEALDGSGKPPEEIRMPEPGDGGISLILIDVNMTS